MTDFKIGQIVKHTVFGEGTIKNVSSKDGKDILTIIFDEGEKALDPSIANLEIVGENEFEQIKQAFREVLNEEIGENLADLIAQSVKSAILLEKGDIPVELGEKWIGGEIVIKPGRSELKEKVVPIETFFHKIVMVRDRLRVLEQNINSHKKLDDEDKVNLQQYITRCYGSLTTFNVLFANRKDWFVGESTKK